MDKIVETNLKNLNQLIKIYKTQAAFAEKINKPSAQISQWVNGFRNISRSTKREIEKKLGLNEGWLDQEHECESTDDNFPVLLDISNNELEDFISIDQFDVQASCGNGVTNLEFPDFIRRIDIPKNEFTEWFGSNHHQGVQILTIKGDSMEPTIPNRSIVFVDSKVQHFTGDGIYAFVLEGNTYIKRLQRVPGKLIAKSDNPIYEPFEITPDQEDQMFIAAKFIRVLPFNMRDL